MRNILVSNNSCLPVFASIEDPFLRLGVKDTRYFSGGMFSQFDGSGKTSIWQNLKDMFGLRCDSTQFISPHIEFQADIIVVERMQEVLRSQNLYYFWVITGELIKEGRFVWRLQLNEVQSVGVKVTAIERHIRKDMEAFSNALTAMLDKNAVSKAVVDVLTEFDQLFLSLESQAKANQLVIDMGVSLYIPLIYIYLAEIKKIPINTLTDADFSAIGARLLGATHYHAKKQRSDNGSSQNPHSPSYPPLSWLWEYMDLDCIISGLRSAFVDQDTSTQQEALGTYAWPIGADRLTYQQGMLNAVVEVLQDKAGGVPRLIQSNIKDFVKCLKGIDTEQPMA